MEGSPHQNPYAAPQHLGAPPASSDEAKERPRSLSFLLGLCIFKLVLVACFMVAVIVLASRAVAGDLSAFERGCIAGLGYAPDEFGHFEAGYTAGQLMPAALVNSAYLVGVRRRLRRFLIGVFVVDVLFTLASPTTLVSLCVSGLLLFNRKAQAHLRWTPSAG